MGGESQRICHFELIRAEASADTSETKYGEESMS